MSSPSVDLFSAVDVGGLQLPNRVCMEPMKVPGINTDGTPSAEVGAYYARRAGAGLIVTQSLWVSRQGRGYELSPGLASARHRDAWRAVAEAVHARGGRVFAQLTHSGRLSHSGLTGFTPVAPSAVAVGGVGFRLRTGMLTAPVPEELTLAQISDIRDAFERSTEYALEAGFDGVELHGCNGYLVSQFLSTNANLRTDVYGGHYEKRARFALEVLEAMIRVAGPSRVGVKLSPLKFSLYDVEEGDASKLNPYLAQACDAFKLAYMNIQRPVGETSNGGLPFDVLDLFRPHFRGVLIACGSMHSRAEAEHYLGSLRADMIGFGRSFAEHPDFMESLEHSGKEIRPSLDPNPIIVRTHKHAFSSESRDRLPNQWMQKPWTRKVHSPE